MKENPFLKRVELAKSILDSALQKIAQLGLKARVVLKTERKGMPDSFTTLMPERVTYHE